MAARMIHAEYPRFRSRERYVARYSTMATPCNSHDLRDSVADNCNLSTRFNHFFIAVREGDEKELTSILPYLAMKYQSVMNLTKL